MSPASSIALDLHQRIGRFRARLYRTEAVAKAYLVGAIVIISIAAVAILEMIFHFDASARTSLVILAVVVYGSCGVWMVLRPLLKTAGIISRDDNYVMAGMIGEFFPSVRDKLTNFLQLQAEASRGESLYSSDLLEASFIDIAGVMRPVDFDRAVDTSAIGRMRRLFVGGAAGVVLLLAVFPASLPEAGYRLAHFGTEFTPPPRYTFDVSPGNKEIIKGESVGIRVRLTSTVEFSQPPRTIQLLYR
ncbi:MAG TPA: hypothetical protein VMM37_01830, partial [Bacteroidota bacterium]|nr:hypothetical protein [Bacteroidota bacterium]